jgi:regulator of sigma E protease
MFSVLGFILILGPLLVAALHELGHFLFARLFGVKAEVFSVGFGPTIWSKQRGETEWKVSAVPSGAVKLLGEEPGRELSKDEELSRSLHKARPWKRLLIFAGGPLFNFIFASLVFMAIQVIGEEQPRSVAGRILPGSVAEKAGLRAGDQVLEVAGHKVRTFEEMMGAFAEHPGRQVQFKVQRSGASAPVDLAVTPSSEPGFNQFGEKTPVGDVGGLLPAARDLVVGVSNPASFAGGLGVMTGDRVATLGGNAPSNFEELEAQYSALPVGSMVRVEFTPHRAANVEQGLPRNTCRILC